MLWLILLASLMAGGTWVTEPSTEIAKQFRGGELVKFQEYAMVSSNDSRLTATPSLGKKSRACEVDADCALNRPICKYEVCKAVPYYNASAGECDCTLGEWEACGMRVLKSIQGQSVSNCYRQCDADAHCEAFQGNYDENYSFNCTLLQLDFRYLDGHGVITGNGLRHPQQHLSSYCFARPVLHSQCKAHVGCLSHQETFCCPTELGIMMTCCDSSPSPMAIATIVTFNIALVLVCSLICNARQCCSGQQPLATRQNIPDTDVVVIPHLDPAVYQDEEFRSEVRALRQALRETQKYIIAFQNPGSGDQSGEHFQSIFKRLVDTGTQDGAGRYSTITHGDARRLPGDLDNGIEHAARKLDEGFSVRVLACGGDGTVTWVLSAFQRHPAFRERELPPVGIIPFGTGNDLARSLGWGPVMTDARELVTYIRRAVEADVVELDQWKLTLRPQSFLPPALTLAAPAGTGIEYEGYFTNYFSVGMDAKTTYEVGEARRDGCGRWCFKQRCCRPCRFIHGGLVCYLLNSPNPIRCFCCRTRALNKDLEVTLDESTEPLHLASEVRQFTLTNLNSYGAGMHLYDNQQMIRSVHPDDGKLEVFTREGPYSVMGMTLAKKVMRAPCGSIRILQQPRRVQMKLARGQFFQMDGEPWVLNSGCHATVEPHRKVRMLCPPNAGPGGGIWTGPQMRSFWERGAQGAGDGHVFDSYERSLP